MVTHSPDHSSVFSAIADPTRRAILDLVRGNDLSAGEVAQRFPVSRPAISRHLRILRQAGLVRETRHARQRVYTLAPESLQTVDRWLAQYRVFWNARLLDLKRYVETAHPQPGAAAPEDRP